MGARKKLQKKDLRRFTKKRVYIGAKKSDKKEDVNGNRKLFWKEVRKANGGKVESSNRIKD